MEKEFSRKIFTPKLLITDSLFLMSRMPRMISLLFDKHITRAFAEKIFAVVTAVNGCSYCTWFHAKAAVASGISDDELKNMLNLQFQADADDFEIPALLYAQHYAETNRNPDPEMTQRLEMFYGKKTARNIFLVIRIIFFGNLIGNTSDAFVSRLKGQKAPNSSALFECFFFLLSAPVLLPLMPFTKKYRQNTADQ